MALVLWFATIIIIAGGQSISAQDTIPNGNFGFELGAAGPSLKYPSVSLGLWSSISEYSFVCLEAGYGGRGLIFRRNGVDETFQQTHQRYFVSALYNFVMDRNQRRTFNLAIGPYYMSMQAQIGQSFIDDFPAGGLTAHSGARYHLQRLGMLPGVGIHAFAGRARFSMQIQIPLYYEESSFDNIQNPLLVVDFDPKEVNDYQRVISQFSAGFVVSIRAGIVFNKWKHKSSAHEMRKD